MFKQTFATLSRYILTIVLLLSVNITVFSQDLSNYNRQTTYYVDDYANLFSKSEILNLDRILRKFHDTVQILVVTVPTFGNSTALDWARAYSNKYGVGTKANDGIVIALSKNDKKIATATGNGIGSLFTDGDAKLFHEKYAIPYFKKEEYYNGVLSHLTNLIAHLSPSGREHQAFVDRSIENKNSIKSAENISSVKNFFNYFLWIVLLLLIGYVIYFLNKRNNEVKAKYQGLKDNLNKLVNDLYHNYIAKSNDTRIYHNSLMSYDPQLFNPAYRIKWYHSYEYINKKVSALEELVNIYTDISNKTILYYNHIENKYKDICNHFEFLNVRTNLVYIKNDINNKIFDKLMSDYNSEYNVLKSVYNKLKNAYIKKSQEQFNYLMSDYSKTTIDKYKERLDKWLDVQENIVQFIGNITTVPYYGVEFPFKERDLLPDFIPEFLIKKEANNYLVQEANRIKKHIIDNISSPSFEEKEYYDKYNNVIERNNALCEEVKLLFSQSNKLVSDAKSYRNYINNEYSNNLIWSKIESSKLLLNELNKLTNKCESLLAENRYKDVIKEMMTVDNIYSRYKLEYNIVLNKIKEEEERIRKEKERREKEEQERLRKQREEREERERKRRQAEEDAAIAAAYISSSSNSSYSSSNSSFGSSFGGGDSSGGGAESSWD